MISLLLSFGIFLVNCGDDDDKPDPLAEKADLIVANNVYAHVPDINDFTKGLKELLKPGGTITLEFPHIMRLIEYRQFDTIYHEHFSYLSLISVIRIFKTAGLRVWDVEELPTHGGSLRVFGCHLNDDRSTEKSVYNLIKAEKLFFSSFLPSSISSF